MAFADRTVTVEVPATSANLGPGFDCMGLALGLHDTLTASMSSTLEVVVEGEGAADLPRDERHLVVAAMRATWERLEHPSAPVELHCLNRIPQSRGLGSSSAAIVAGIVLARELLVDGVERLDDLAVLALAAELEGHPDNVAPAMLGGFVVCGQDLREGQEDGWAVRLPVVPGIRATAFVPPYGVRTELARGMLPETVTHSDASANTGRAALLVAALTQAPDQLLRATEDFLHQEHRRSAMPETLDLVHRLRNAGVAAFISGAGPTVLVLGVGEQDLAPLCPDRWQMLELDIAVPGARAV